MPIHYCAESCFITISKLAILQYAHAQIILGNPIYWKTYITYFYLQDGTLWEPSRYSIICAQHFMSGAPSIEPDNIDYAPTIFDDYKYGVHKIKEFVKPLPRIVGRCCIGSCYFSSKIPRFSTENIRFFPVISDNVVQTDSWIKIIRKITPYHEVNYFNIIELFMI